MFSLPGRFHISVPLALISAAALIFETPLCAEAGEAAEKLTSIPNLICFWDFQNSAQGHLTAKGSSTYTLEEMNGPIAQTAEGIFGDSSLQIKRGQWLRIKREDCPALNLHGKQEVSIIAWIKRKSPEHWQFIAGMWDERGAKRQYGLFTSGHKQTDHTTMERTDANHQTHGYVSDVGGATPGKPFCFSYATGKQTVETGKWYMIAFTYDHKALKVYVNGELDANGNYNPFPWDKPIFDGGSNGSDFTVGQRDHPKWPTYPEGKITNKEGFAGTLGGLAVYGRALNEEEIRGVYEATKKNLSAPTGPAKE